MKQNKNHLSFAKGFEVLPTKGVSNFVKNVTESDKQLVSSV